MSLSIHYATLEINSKYTGPVSLKITHLDGKAIITRKDNNAGKSLKEEERVRLNIRWPDPINGVVSTRSEAS